MRAVLKKFLSLLCTFLIIFFSHICCLYTLDLHSLHPKTIDTLERESKIEEKDGVVTVNGKAVHFVPDEKIKLIDAYFEEYRRDVLEKYLGGPIKFVKPEELSNDGIVCKLFGKASPQAFEIQQGKLGVCAFLATLSSLTDTDPNLIRENLMEHGDNFVIVKFFDFESQEPVYIMVQKTIPILPKEYSFLRNDCLWVHMYLKAYVALVLTLEQKDRITYEQAKLYIKVPSMLWFPKLVTGRSVNILPCRESGIKKEELYDKIKEAIDEKEIMICSFDDTKWSKIPILKYFAKKIEPQGFLKYHAYSVWRVFEDINGEKFVCCRNPWGRHVPLYCNDKLQTAELPHWCGYFDLKLDDFYKYCNDICFTIKESAEDKPPKNQKENLRL